MTCLAVAANSEVVVVAVVVIVLLAPVSVFVVQSVSMGPAMSKDARPACVVGVFLPPLSRELTEHPSPPWLHQRSVHSTFSFVCCFP